MNQAGSQQELDYVLEQKAEECLISEYLQKSEAESRFAGGQQDSTKELYPRPKGRRRKQDQPLERVKDT